MVKTMSNAVSTVSRKKSTGVEDVAEGYSAKRIKLTFSLGILIMIYNNLKISACNSIEV